VIKLIIVNIIKRSVNLVNVVIMQMISRVGTNHLNTEMIAIESNKTK
jgi:hypothetical protein